MATPAPTAAAAVSRAAHITDDLRNRPTAAYLDFVTSLRLYNAREIRPRLRQVYDAAEAAQGPLSSLEETQAVLDGTSLARWWKRLSRTSQEMNWAGSRDAMLLAAQELEASIQEAAGRGPGRLILDPDLVYPPYFDETEFHIQPGSYHGHGLSGYMYYFGVQVFHAGTPNDPMLRRPAMVQAAPVPPDGRVNRIVELACSIGFCTQAWKRRFPEAEVWGTDISAPMVRYAHKRAVDEGLDITFAQMAAEDLKFADDSVDLVFVNILFHELPVPVIRQVLREVYRVLRPGGIFVCADFGPASRWNGWDAWVREFDSFHNGEPFAWDFCHLDLVREMEAVGFREVADTPQEGVIATQRTGIK